MTAKTTSAGISGRRALPTARDLVVWVINELPKADLSLQVRRFEELLDFNPHCQPQVNEHYFKGAEKDIRSTKSKADRDKARVESDVRVRAAADRVKVLLLTMTNGKRMADCTGAEMMAEGKLYERIAEAVGHDKRVGDVLCEDDVRRLMAPRRR